MMKIYKTIIKSFIILLFVILSFNLFSGEIKAETVLFEDNFNKGTAEKWFVVGSPSNWQVVNEEYGIVVYSGVTNSIPTDAFWNPTWKNFIYKVDLKGLQGTDKNILIKFLDTSNFYEIHHTGGRIHFEKVIAGKPYIVAPSIEYPLNNGEVYNFKFEIRGNNFKVYERENLLFNVTDKLPLFEGGKIGLRAGTGAVSPTEVWFDNVSVTAIEDETLGPFELPVGYDGRNSNDPDKFKTAFWNKLNAAFDHVFKPGIFQPFTGQKYSPVDCPPWKIGITCYDSHNGTDFSRSGGKEVFSTTEGKVVFTSQHTNSSCTPNRGGFGCVVIVEHPNNLYSLYAHLEKIFVNTNDNVNLSTKLGVMGNTGCPSCGVHLHFGVLKPNTSSASIRMTKNDWQGLLYTIKPLQTSAFQPFCTYRAPNGISFSFQDPSGWKSLEIDPWSKSKENGGCGMASPYLWKYEVGLEK